MTTIRDEIEAPKYFGVTEEDAVIIIPLISDLLSSFDAESIPNVLESIHWKVDEHQSPITWSESALLQAIKRLSQGLLKMQNAKKRETLKQKIISDVVAIVKQINENQDGNITNNIEITIDERFREYL